MGIWFIDIYFCSFFIHCLLHNLSNALMLLLNLFFSILPQSFLHYWCGSPDISFQFTYFFHLYFSNFKLSMVPDLDSRDFTFICIYFWTNCFGHPTYIFHLHLLVSPWICVMLCLSCFWLYHFSFCLICFCVVLLLWKQQLHSCKSGNFSYSATVKS